MREVSATTPEGRRARVPSKSGWPTPCSGMKCFGLARIMLRCRGPRHALPETEPERAPQAPRSLEFSSQWLRTTTAQALATPVQASKCRDLR